MDLALLLLRLTVGLLLAGHGAQKLFGWFGGGGPAKTGGWLASVGFHPGGLWAWLAGGSEFFGGVSFALGLFHPLGSIGIGAVMLMAIWKVHWPKIWNSAGGLEFPFTFFMVALAVGLSGPGAYSLDAYLGITVPGMITAAALIIAIGLWVFGFISSSKTAQPSSTSQASR